MKRLNLLKSALAVTAAITMLAGCGNDKGSQPGNSPASTQSGADNSSYSTDFSSFPNKLNAEKIGSLSISTNNIIITDGGAYYKDSSDKYGIVSHDGTKDSGPIYDYCEQMGRLFAVAKSLPSEGDATALNCFGVVDAMGNEIVPAKYASATMVGDRYIRVCTITEATDSKDDALVYGTDDMFSFIANEDDDFYKGNWYIYDTQTGKQIEGLTGTKPYAISSYGDCICYTNDDGEKIYANSKGEALSSDARVIDGGYYKTEKDKNGTVYSLDGKELFKYNTDDYSVSAYDEEADLFKASKYADGKTIYILLDKSGKKISAEFDGVPVIYGKYVLALNKLYDFDGKVITEGEVDNVYMDPITKNAVMVKISDTDITLLDMDGKELYKSDAGSKVDSSTFLASKNVSGKTMYYSLKDKDYTIDGHNCGPWIVSVSGDKSNALVDTISGETMLEGYKTYQYCNADGKAHYIYAKVQDGQYDVYLIK